MSRSVADEPQQRGTPRAESQHRDTSGVHERQQLGMSTVVVLETPAVLAAVIGEKDGEGEGMQQQRNASGDAVLVEPAIGQRRREMQRSRSSSSSSSGCSFPMRIVTR